MMRPCVGCSSGSDPLLPEHAEPRPLTLLGRSEKMARRPYRMEPRIIL